MVRVRVISNVMVMLTVRNTEKVGMSSSRLFSVVKGAYCVEREQIRDGL